MINWEKIAHSMSANVSRLCDMLEIARAEVAKERERADQLERRLKLYKAAAKVDANLGEMKVLIDNGCFLPESAHEQDAGYDLRTPKSFSVPVGGSATVDTGVHMMIPNGYAGVLISKSGLNVKHGLTSTGLIDAGYTGSIVVKLYNNGIAPASFARGEKISQIVIIPIAKPALHQVATLEQLGSSERGTSGFGSTGK